MKLTDFIRTNSERILQQWEEFARRLSDSNLPRWILRDHAPVILKFIADRMQGPSQPIEQRLTAVVEGGENPVHSVTEAHIQIRIDSGFDLAQITSEYCALRACVTDLWRKSDSKGFADGATEIVRFSEVVDENITAAVSHYKDRESRYRDQFIGILGHDLRNPINAITLNTALLTKQDPSEEQLKIAARILKSARELTRMSSDLLDFARGRLGSSMPINPVSTDIGVVVRDVVTELQAANPGSRIEFDSSGDLKGDWDVDRLKQLVSNLLLNAIQHGAGKDVRVAVEDEGSRVALRFHNQGPSIPDTLIATMFDPLIRGRNTTDSSGIGLGLFIVDQIVTAHKGTIAVTSSEDSGTTFVVRLPRHTT
jgi:signal transduction histidine kinase